MSAQDMFNVFLGGLESLAGHLGTTLRAGADAQLIKQGITALVAAGKPLVEPGKAVVRDGIAQQIERELFDPSAAVLPATYLLQVHDSIKRQGDEMLILAHDDRFAWSWLWEPGVEIRVPPSEFVEQMIGLAAAVGMEVRETRLAWETILKLRDPRQAFGGSPDGPPLPDARGQGFVLPLIPLPARPYRTEAKKVRDLRFRLVLFGARLIKLATDGQRRLERASLDHRAYDPATVVSETVRLSVTLASILLTCAEIGDLALRPARAPRLDKGGDKATPPVPAV